MCEEAFYRFDHARSREVLYEALSLPLKEVITPELPSDWKARVRMESLPFADLAYHYAQAGNEEKAVKYSLAAGQEALARCSNKEAIESFQFVIQKVGRYS